MAIRLTFVDSDNNYIEKLAAWINKYMPCQFSIEVLTSPESFKTWTESGKKADAIIVSVDIFKNLQQPFSKDGIIILDNGSHQDLGAEIPRIFRYRHAEEIMKDIVSLCADRLPGIHASERHDVRINVVTYIDGSDSLYPVAPSLAYLFAGKGKKTFYLSLEHNQTTDLYFFSGNRTRGFNEMLYYIKSNKDNLSMRLEACANQDANSGIDFLKAPPGLLFPKDMETGDIDKLISSIAERNVYDEIVLAADAIMDEKFVHLLKRADRIFFISGNTSSPCLKLGKLVAELKKYDSDQGAITGKLKLILIKLRESNCFNEQFPYIAKAYIPFNPPELNAGWVPSETDLLPIAGLISDI